GDCYVVFFFFQAEDGIRDRNVTGVQTCALPISLRAGAWECIAPILRRISSASWGGAMHSQAPARNAASRCSRVAASRIVSKMGEIGRASCREREEIAVVAGSVVRKGERRAACSM